MTVQSNGEGKGEGDAKKKVRGIYQFSFSLKQETCNVNEKNQMHICENKMEKCKPRTQGLLVIYNSVKSTI